MYAIKENEKYFYIKVIIYIYRMGLLMNKSSFNDDWLPNLILQNKL